VKCSSVFDGIRENFLDEWIKNVQLNDQNEKPEMVESSSGKILIHNILGSIVPGSP
jgi:hypothetical protein